MFKVGRNCPDYAGFISFIYRHTCFKSMFMSIAKLFLTCLPCFCILSLSCFAGDDDRMTLGVQTLAIADVKEGLLGTRAPKVGVVVLRKEPGCETPFQALDVITHINRQVIKSNEDLKDIITALTEDKKYRLTYQRSVNGKWQKGDVDFKPKSYKQLINDNLDASKDAVAEVTTLRDKRSPETPTRTNVQCRIRETKAGDPALLIRFSYGGDDWIFVEECVVKIEGELTTVKFPRDIMRDNSGGRVWEWFTRVATDEDVKLLNAIASAKSVTIRFMGKYKHDHELTEDEQFAVKNVLEAYRLRGK